MSVTDEVAIEAVRQEFLEAYRAGDAVRLAACCSEDVVQLPPNEPAVRGREAIRTRYQAQFDRFTCDLSVTTEELEIADAWAFAWGTYKIALTPQDGTLPIYDYGKYLAIFRRQQDGSWKFARDTFNSDNPLSRVGEDAPILAKKKTKPTKARSTKRK
jgi:uncharacterized protein (TIGR02246 family)